MKLREKIFGIYKQYSYEEEKQDEYSQSRRFFSYEDPFDFYRKIKDNSAYTPVTQKGLRKAFETGITGIEFYLEMATSLRPLADEAQDIDEITRLLSQQKLTLNPNLNSITILRHLIKDPNPEIALYAAEGINTIENTFIDKILRIKKKIKKTKGREYILRYILGLLYVEFARLLKGQKLIQMFYLNEAVSALKTANELKKKNKRILLTVGDTYMLMGKTKKAIRIFSYLYTEYENDPNVLMKLAECFYKDHDYENVKILTTLASRKAIELDEISKLIIYQWALN
ncbi:MAG: hypothetical protein JW864_08425 [Spirochaetes bacterium]|nr:hypothetical protein [Spirochaetota bacterium]